MNRTFPLAVAIFAVVVAFTSPARAEDDPPTRVARLSYIDGDVSLQPGDSEDWTWASVNRPLTTGDSLWTERHARAEIRIGSTAVRAADRTSLSVLNLDDRSAQFGLNSGTLIVHVKHIPDEGYFEIDTPNVAITLTQPGDYRINAEDSGDYTALDVRSGSAQVTGTRLAFKVTTGSEAQISGGGDNLSYDFYDLPAGDDFDRWSRMRDWRSAKSRSARYVPEEMTGYEDLDSNGTWVQDPTYGEVWQPTQVAEDWSPYRDGHWAWIEPWGWSWVDDQPWGFATSHYGRWAYLPAGTWAWVPPRRDEAQNWPVYSPANVVFVQNVTVVNYNTPVVSWIPLAPGEAYVPAYHCSHEYLTQLNGTNTVIAGPGVVFEENRVVSPRAFRNLVAASAVVAVTQQAFASAQPVSKAVVRVNVAAVSSKPAAPTAPVAPVKASALPAPAGKPAASAPKPPQQIAQRQVVAKEAPPPKPVPFEKKQQLLQQNAGKPLDAKAVKSLRAQAPQPPVVKAAATPAAAPAAEPERKPRPAQMHGYGRLQPAPQQQGQPSAGPENQPAAKTPQQQREEERQQQEDQRKAEQQQKQEEQQQFRQQQEQQQKADQQQQQEERQKQEEQRKADQQQKQEEQQQLRQQHQQEEEQQKTQQQQKQEEQQQLRQQEEEQQKADQQQKQGEQQQLRQQRQQEEEQQKTQQQQKQEEQQQLRQQEDEQRKADQQQKQEEQQQLRQQHQQEEEQQKSGQQQKQEDQQQLRQQDQEQRKTEQQQKQEEQQKLEQQKKDEAQQKSDAARQKKLDEEQKAREEKQPNNPNGEGQPPAP